MQHPKLILADEFVSQLDHVTAEEILESMHAIVGTGVGMLVTTHEIDVVMNHADRVLIMQGGRIVHDAAPSLLSVRRPHRTSTMTRRMPVARIAIGDVFGLGLLALWDVGLLDIGEWGPAISNLVDFTGSLFPPETESLGTLVDAMIETIEIAFVGTLIGLVLSLPLAVLGTRTLFGPAVTAPARLLDRRRPHDPVAPVGRRLRRRVRTGSSRGGNGRCSLYCRLSGQALLRGLRIRRSRGAGGGQSDRREPPTAHRIRGAPGIGKCYRQPAAVHVRVQHPRLQHHGLRWCRRHRLLHAWLPCNCSSTRT